MADSLGHSDNWDQHWDRYAASAEINPAQAYRRECIFDLLQAPPHAHILDIGSGQGDFAAQVKKRLPDAKLLGIELSASGVSISSRKFPEAVFLERDLTHEAPIPSQYSGWATHAVCSEMLEHVDDPSVVLRNIRSYMATNCRLIVTVPAGPMSAFDKHIGHRRHFTAELLREVASTSGFRVQRIYRAGFPFLNLYRLAVILRGDKLAADVEGPTSNGGILMRTVLVLFRFLFHFNLRATPFGWQIVAVLTKE